MSYLLPLSSDITDVIQAVAEDLLQNKPFQLSENDYDGLGAGVYFWESNPIPALDWAKPSSERETWR
jgi:hypothetical protein